MLTMPRLWSLLLPLALRAATVCAQSQGHQDGMVRTVFDIIGETNRYYVEIGFNSPAFERGTGANTFLPASLSRLRFGCRGRGATRHQHGVARIPTPLAGRRERFARSFYTTRVYGGAAATVTARARPSSGRTPRFPARAATVLRRRYALHARGWTGLLLDSAFENATINLRKALVSSANIVQLFARHGVPVEPDFVSVDVDTADLWILGALLETYRPRAASVEYNSAFGDGADGASLAFPDPAWMPGAAGASWSGTCFMGSSAKAIYALAHAHGYRVVGVVDGLDLLLVRADLWPWPGLELGAVAARRDTFRAMTAADAALLLDYDVFRRGGSLCEARAAAATFLRRRAREVADAGTCACAYHGPFFDCLNHTETCSCFRNLVDLPVPRCAAAARPDASTAGSHYPLVISDDEWTGTLAVPQAYHEAGRLHRDWFEKAMYV